jgi:hypothetical protein
LIWSSRISETFPMSKRYDLYDLSLFGTVE